MKFAVTIISPPGYPHSECFREVAETLDYGLQALGHDCLITTSGRLPGRRHIVLGSNLLPRYPVELAPDAILYNLEQIRGNKLWVKERLLDILGRYIVWDYSDDNAAALGELGMQVAHRLPIGYAPLLTRIEPAPEPDIDILFAGSINPRRQAVLDAMRRAGLVVVNLFGAYGAVRDAAIARAKLLLNMHFYPAKILEIVRVSYYMANGFPVLSERSANPSEDVEFADGIAFASYDDLVVQAKELCQSVKKRREIGARGYELIRARPIENALGPALETLG